MDIIDIIKKLPTVEGLDPPEFSFRDVVSFIVDGPVDGPDDGPVEELIFKDNQIPPTNQEVLDKIEQIKLTIKEHFKL